MDIDKRKLADELTDAFIQYQHNLEEPMPHPSQSKATIIAKYQNDVMFRRRVDILVSGVMAIVSRHLP